MNSRTALEAYAKKHGIPVPTSKKFPWSSDRNLLHISFEGGILEDPWREPDEDMYVLTVSPEKSPDEPAYVAVDFEAGNPVAVNGDRLSPAALLARLNELGGRHGVGRVDMVENRFVGMKSRGVYETPGGTILRAAHQAVESITMDREVLHLRDSLVPKYAQLVYNGFWFAPERLAIQSLVTESQKTVSGEVRLKLYKGNVMQAGRRSPHSMYDEHVATMEGGQEAAYNQDDATGFIALNALRLKANAKQK
jgi:argininosuccinate synthase